MAVFAYIAFAGCFLGVASLSNPPAFLLDAVGCLAGALAIILKARKADFRDAASKLIGNFFVGLGIPTPIVYYAHLEWVEVPQVRVALATLCGMSGWWMAGKIFQWRDKKAAEMAEKEFTKELRDLGYDRNGNPIANLKDDPSQYSPPAEMRHR